MESNDSPEIPDWEGTSDIHGFPSGFDRMNPCCDLSLKDSKQICLRDIPAYGDSSPNQVW